MDQIITFSEKIDFRNTVGTKPQFPKTLNRQLFLLLFGILSRQYKFLSEVLLTIPLPTLSVYIIKYIMVLRAQGVLNLQSWIRAISSN